MQGYVVELIRELMQTQHMSIRKISAQIAKKHGGSAMGYTQQISRILNDPDYDPTFSTVQKILAALNVSLWQPMATPSNFEGLETQLHQLSQDVETLKTTVDGLHGSVRSLSEHLQVNRDETRTL